MRQVPCALCRSECWEIGAESLSATCQSSPSHGMASTNSQHTVTLTHHPSHPTLPGPGKVGRAVAPAPGSWGAESPEGAMSAFGPCHLMPHPFQLGLDFLSLRQVPSHNSLPRALCAPGSPAWVVSWLSCSSIPRPLSAGSFSRAAY